MPGYSASGSKAPSVKMCTTSPAAARISIGGPCRTRFLKKVKALTRLSFNVEEPLSDVARFPISCNDKFAMRPNMKLSNQISLPRNVSPSLHVILFVSKCLEMVCSSSSFRESVCLKKTTPSPNLEKSMTTPKTSMCWLNGFHFFPSRENRSPNKSKSMATCCSDCEAMSARLMIGKSSKNVPAQTWRPIVRIWNTAVLTRKNPDTLPEAPNGKAFNPYMAHESSPGFGTAILMKLLSKECSGYCLYAEDRSNVFPISSAPAYNNLTIVVARKSRPKSFGFSIIPHVAFTPLVLKLSITLTFFFCCSPNLCVKEKPSDSWLSSRHIHSRSTSSCVSSHAALTISSSSEAEARARTERFKPRDIPSNPVTVRLGCFGSFSKQPESRSQPVTLKPAQMSSTKCVSGYEMSRNISPKSSNRFPLRTAEQCGAKLWCSARSAPDNWAALKVHFFNHAALLARIVEVSPTIFCFNKLSMLSMDLKSRKRGCPALIASLTKSSGSLGMPKEIFSTASSSLYSFVFPKDWPPTSLTRTSPHFKSLRCTMRAPLGNVSKICCTKFSLWPLQKAM